MCHKVQTWVHLHNSYYNYALLLGSASIELHLVSHGSKLVKELLVSLVVFQYI